VDSKGKGKSRDGGGRYRDLPDEEERIGDDPDETRRWEQEEQQVSSYTLIRVEILMCRCMSRDRTIH
jgi:hypothetical protein